MTFKSTVNPMFRSSFAEDIFNQKYRHEGAETWEALSRLVVDDVCGPYLNGDDKGQLYEHIRDLKFIPGGRYLYYAGRSKRFFNNCYLLRAEEDTREDWADLVWKATSCLMTGGGIGIDYSRYRGHGAPLVATGGVASGPIPCMKMINEIGRNVQQGGSRRSALYASLDWDHADVEAFLRSKNWDEKVRRLKEDDFNFPAPLDCTNVSVNYKDAWLNLPERHKDPVFLKNVRQALKTGEPGFSFNFGTKQNETLRNACTEITSADDSDVCNLGSVNMGRIESLEEFQDVCHLGTLFLLCGTLRADLPYPRVSVVRQKNRRLGLGLMGVHEWLLKRGLRYEVNARLADWLSTYSASADIAAYMGSQELSISRPVATRAIAPTGTIGILAGTSSGVEPLFATAYKRRYLKNGTTWAHQYVVDSVAEGFIEDQGIAPHDIETALDLAQDPERRIAMQAFVQRFVDQGISSTINLPAWSDREDRAEEFANLISKYAPGLRGLTVYPDGARGGQPLTPVPYWVAKDRKGEELEVEAHDICTISGKGGVCGV